jgi:amidase
MTAFSRRRFLEATALLAASAPLAGCVRGAGGTAPMDAVAMADAVRTGRTTASALVEAAIARLEKVNPQLKAVAYPNFDRARAAAAVNPAGPLGGVPTLIKDITPQAGLPYTSGVRAYRTRVADRTSAYLEAVDRSGAISIGRSTTPEFGLTATTEPLLTGPTRNPWSLEHSAGGSSGGSGAAVAAGVVPVAHATDGGGSIRIPASVNGLVGLKPSRGRMAGSANDRDITAVSVANCVSRTVRDTAAWYAATEATGADARFTPVGVVAGPSERRLRVGMNLRRGDGSLPHADVQNVFSNAQLLLQRLGHRVSDQPLPFDGAKSADAFNTLWGAGAARNIQEVTKFLGRAPGPGDLEPLTFAMAAVAQKAGPEGVRNAIAVLTDVANRYNAQFEAIDIYMTPVLALPPVPIGFLATTQPYEVQAERLLSYVAYTPIENVAGAPSIALPMGMSRDGLPIGIQFATKPGGERLLLELAFELERELEWYRQTPPLWVGA